MLMHAHPQPVPPKRLVILGGSGFVGSAVAALAQQQDIPMLALNSAEVDLAADDAAGKLAAQLQPQDSIVFFSAKDLGNASGSDSLLANLAMARNVALAARQAKPAHLIYISSDAVYAPEQVLVSEATLPAPTTIYGIMHRAREIILATESETPLAVLRLTAVYGEGDTHNAYGPNRFGRQAQAEKIITLFGDGEEMRDHLHVDDAAQMILLTALRGSTGVLNLATGRSLAFATIAEAIAREAGAKITNAPRRQPVTHRHYDVTARIKAFPAFTPLQKF